ncbi:MAG: hypothetical protein ACYCO0_01060 [Candidatus Micrarchaeaceae archaeon]
MSDDGRMRTQEYLKGGESAFSIAEQTRVGSLITEFNSSNEVLNQVCLRYGDAKAAVAAYLGIREGDIRIESAGGYSGVRVDAKCRGCGASGLGRELDCVVPSEIKDIPVVPIFVCMKCKKRHYMLTDSYLNELVKNNDALFEKDEMAEINRDLGSSIKMLQEYIIRIFASKKISRVETW